MSRPSFSRQDQEEVRRTWRVEGAAQCPLCEVSLVARPVAQPVEVSYVRHRSWLTCPSCHRAVIADDPRRTD